MCCAFVGLDNELYYVHGTYIKIRQAMNCNIILWGVRTTISPCKNNNAFPL